MPSTIALFTVIGVVTASINTLADCLSRESPPPCSEVKLLSYSYNKRAESCNVVLRIGNRGEVLKLLLPTCPEKSDLESKRLYKVSFACRDIVTTSGTVKTPDSLELIEPEACRITPEENMRKVRESAQKIDVGTPEADLKKAGFHRLSLHYRERDKVMADYHIYPGVWVHVALKRRCADCSDLVVAEQIKAQNIKRSHIYEAVNGVIPMKYKKDAEAGGAGRK